jgi:hypothetical protein
MLTLNEQHQELNKVADKLAKGSLLQPSATIPFSYEFLPSVSVCVNHEDGVYVFENKAHKLFTKHYKSLNKQYHFRGQWHRHLLTDAVWQEASLHILHLIKALYHWFLEKVSCSNPWSHSAHISSPSQNPSSTLPGRKLYTMLIDRQNH